MARIRQSQKQPVERQHKGKRGNNEGTIYRRLDKRKVDGTIELRERWCAAVTLPNGTRQVLYGKTRQEAADKLTAAHHDRQTGVAPANRRETVGSWLTKYVDDLEARGTSHATLTRYRGILSRYLVPELGRHKLADLQPHHVRDYQAALLKGGASARSVTVHRAILSGALKQAAAEGLVPRNVVALAKPPKRERASIGKTLAPGAARVFLEAIEGDRLEAFYLVALTAGLRRGEALGLRWNDLDLDGPAATLRVGQQLQWPKGVPTLVKLKSRQGARTVPLPALTVDALRARHVAQRTEREIIDDAWSADGLVFNSEAGAPVHRSTIGRQFLENVARANLGHLRLHDLRHTYGSLLMSQGVPLKTISELMGHASIDVTADTYLHSLDVQVNDTAQSVEKALAAPASGSHAARDGHCPTCGQSLPEG